MGGVANVQRLLEQGANPNVMLGAHDTVVSTPVFIVASMGNATEGVALLRLLLESGADPDVGSFAVADRSRTRAR
jgi:hypothetical protein